MDKEDSRVEIDEYVFMWVCVVSTVISIFIVDWLLTSSEHRARLEALLTQPLPPTPVGQPRRSAVAEPRRRAMLETVPPTYEGPPAYDELYPATRCVA